MNWVEYAKKSKAEASAKKEPSLPTVILQSKDEALAAVKSPNDKYQCLTALQQSLRIDYIDKAVMILDAHYASVDPNKKVDPFLKYKNQNKSLQERKEQGDDSISEALICMEVDIPTKAIKTHVILYKSIGTEVEWTEEHDLNEGDGITAGGYLYDTVKKILDERESQPSVVKHLIDLTKDVPGFKEITGSEDRLKFHTLRGFFSILKTRGYEVIDFISEKHPEWIDK